MDLTSNDYYELSCSLIPDNIYKQIVGTYKDMSFSSEKSFAPNDPYDEAIVVYASGTQALASLPLVDIESSSFYENVYSELVNWNYVEQHVQNRTERVRVRIHVEIEEDMPFLYMPSESTVSVSEITGKLYSRVMNTVGYAPWWEDTFAVFDNATNKLYGLKVWNGGTDVPSANDNKTISDLSDIDITNVVVDSYYDGTVLGPNSRYLMKMDVYLYVYDTYMSRNTNNIERVEGVLNMKIVESFKLSIPYYILDEYDVDFEYHVDTPDYASYPLKINGNYLTTSNTFGGNKQWAKFISDILLDKYENGKFWVSAKVKASFLIENDLVIDSVIQIKDLNGNRISRSGTALSFQLKNIEYSFSGSQFIANIILLEV